MNTEPILAELYTKQGCDLCHEMERVIEQIRAEYPLTLREIDITSAPSLMARFGEEIPVLFLDGRKAFKFRMTESALRRRLELLLLRRRLRKAALRSDR